MPETRLIGTSFSKFVRAIFIVKIALFISVTVPANAKQNAFKAQLLRAQETFLGKDRTGAIKILQQIRTTGLKPEERDELNETLKDVATRFLTDKGQRGYELGISQLPGQAASALNHLREVESVESGNLRIQIAILRAHLAGDDCRSAARMVPMLSSLFWVFPKLNELEMQLAWCLEKSDDIQELLKRKTNETKLSPALQKTASAWLKWRDKENDKALALLREAAMAEPANPAILYWLWRVEKDQGADAQAAATAFSKRCRNYEAEYRRHSGSMIEMCLHRSEVEAYLKAKGTESSDAD